MIIGADTGYFISQASNHPRALQIWHELQAGQHIMIVSTLNINEAFVYSYRRGFSQERLGLSTVDAVILATFVETGCELVVTADSDFKTARHQQVIPIELLT